MIGGMVIIPFPLFVSVNCQYLYSPPRFVNIGSYKAHIVITSR